jgi:hypothetical protein
MYDRNRPAFKPGVAFVFDRPLRRQGTWIRFAAIFAARGRKVLARIEDHADRIVIRGADLPLSAVDKRDRKARRVGCGLKFIVDFA